MIFDDKKERNYGESTRYINSSTLHRDSNLIPRYLTLYRTLPHISHIIPRYPTLSHIPHIIPRYPTYPTLSHVLGLLILTAPLSNSSFTISECPFCAEMKSAVALSSIAASVFAPLSNSSFTVSECPFCERGCHAVFSGFCICTLL